MALIPQTGILSIHRIGKIIVILPIGKINNHTKKYLQGSLLLLVE